MDKRERLLAIFIEEANEIIENLDNLMMELEESDEKSEIINNIFRGVHTLKGSANSFGFIRLGEYVHHWEDLLGICRDNTESELVTSSIDLFFDAVNVVREILELEINADESYPQDYHTTLEQIKTLLNSSLKKEEVQEKKIEEIVFDSVYAIADINKKELEFFTSDEKQNILESDKKLYNVILAFDDDLYFRGHNQQISIKLLGELGKIIRTFISFGEIPNFEQYDCDKNYIKKMSLYFLSDNSFQEIEEVFDFVAEEHEVKIRQFSSKEIQEYFSDEVEQKQEIVKEKQENIKKVQQQKHHISVNEYSIIKVESTKIDELFDSVGELVIAQSFIEHSNKITELEDEQLNKNLQTLAKSTKRIQDQVMSLRMIAIKDTFLKMKRVARDVSKKTGKNFDFIIKGEDTEIDKTMVDALNDPLIHLIRNSADHGIESDEIRASLNKPKGVVSLSAYHSGNYIVIEIKDNGAGINTETILQKAIEKGVAKEDEKYTKEEIIGFLFHPGFSMAKKITDISGRGVGLDVVKSAIEKVKGKIVVDSTLGEGSSFKIMLPLTLAIIDGMIVSINNEIFVLPTLSIIESFQPDISKINSIQHKEEFLDYRGEVLPIIHLNRVLNLGSDEKAKEDSIFICIDHDRGKFILRVDSIVGRQQVVVKTLGKFLSFVKELAGGTILGDGNIAFIINIDEIRHKLDTH